ncbi:MAG: HNH endonuclease [Gammaproteobacteria bacterium]|nr:HNH endonuclease [Gammaproteobacteria bacterium]
MNEIDKELICRLKKEAKLPNYWAIPFVRYRGRCGYCGQDLLVDRQGYATAQIDHLLPQSRYCEYKNCPDNWVLSCYLCNQTKRDWDPLKDRPGEDHPSAILKDDQRRADLIAEVRAHISERRAAERGTDWEWRTVEQILGY